MAERKARTSNSGGGPMPTAEPPSMGESTSRFAGAGDRPMDLTDQQMAASLIGGTAGSAPTEFPPAAAISGQVGAIGAWQQDKRVAALWTINQNRNAWVFIAGTGWKKLSNNSDSAIVAMNMLAASARQNQSYFAFREEADGMIHEIYLW